MLGEAKDAGYDGVELMQDPKVLGDPELLFGQLKDHRLALVGIAGGSLEERIEYARTMKSLAESDLDSQGLGWGMQLYRNARPLVLPYVYVDDWRDQRHAHLLKHGDVVLALHTHMFKPVQTAEEAAKVLDAHPEMRFLPDTAHLEVAGDDPVLVIENNFSRLAAVHLKDWTAEFGRSLQFYARGFVGLGEGTAPVKQVVEMLLRRNYQGWLLVEQDTAANPLASAKKSRQWLSEETGV
jgi:sugar phosphate isomerase/epimerase